jgi:hypothetical protein
MPAEFWSNEPEDNRSIDDIVKAFDQVSDGESPVIREYAKVGMKVKPGKDWGVDKPDCYYRASKEKERYSSKNKIGVIESFYANIGQSSADWIRVEWEDNTSDYYRAGKNLGSTFKTSTTGGISFADNNKAPVVEAYDLYVYKESQPIEVLVTAENRKIGMIVKPSSQFGNWKILNNSTIYSNIDSLMSGTITDFHGPEDYKDWVQVKWKNGRTHFYACGSRLGAYSKDGPQFDLAIDDDWTK